MEGKVVTMLNKLNFVPWRHMRARWYNSTILHLSTRWRWESASCPGRKIGGLVVTRVSMNAVEWRKISCPYQESNPDRPANSPSQYHWVIPTKFIIMYETKSMTVKHIQSPVRWVLSNISSAMKPPSVPEVNSTRSVNSSPSVRLHGWYSNITVDDSELNLYHYWGP
jgi:hypothetical protein